MCSCADPLADGHPDADADSCADASDADADADADSRAYAHADSRADVDADHGGAYANSDHRQDGRCGAVFGDPLITPASKMVVRCCF